MSLAGNLLNTETSALRAALAGECEMAEGAASPGADATAPIFLFFLRTSGSGWATMALGAVEDSGFVSIDGATSSDAVFACLERAISTKHLHILAHACEVQGSGVCVLGWMNGITRHYLVETDHQYENACQALVLPSSIF